MALPTVYYLYFLHLYREQSGLMWLHSTFIRNCCKKIQMLIDLQLVWTSLYSFSTQQ